MDAERPLPVRLSCHDHDVSQEISGILVGSAFFVVGLVNTTNLGAFVTSQTRLAYRATSFLRHIPPWRWLAKTDEATIVRREVRRARITGVVLMAAGLWIVLSSMVRGRWHT